MTTEQRNEIIKLWKENTKRTWANFDGNEGGADIASNAIGYLAGMRDVLNALGYDIVWPHDEEYSVCGDPDIWPMWLIEEEIPELRDLAVIEGLDKTMHEHDDVEPTADPTDN